MYSKIACLGRHIRINRLIIIFGLVISGCGGLANNTKTSRSAKVVGHVNKYTKQQDGHPHPSHVPNLANIKDPKPKYEPKSRYGNLPKYTVFNKTYKVLDTSKGYKEKGHASWYGTKFHGFRTSNGEIYDMYSMTAAHKTLPLPTYARVTNLHNKRSVIVRINDRGPFHGNRIIDLSYAAATKLGIIGNGVGMVEVAAITPGMHEVPSYESITVSNNGSANKNPINNQDQNNSTYNFGDLPKSGSTLQLGAFVNHGNAKKLAGQLESLLKNYQQKCKVDIILQKNNLKKTFKENILYKVVVSPVSGELNIKNLKSFLSTAPIAIDI